MVSIQVRGLLPPPRHGNAVSGSLLNSTELPRVMLFKFNEHELGYDPWEPHISFQPDSLDVKVSRLR